MNLLNKVKSFFTKRPKPVKRPTAKDLDFAFKDLDEINYYRHTTQLGIGLEHYGKSMEFTMFMAAGLAPAELNKLLDYAESVVEGLVEGKKGNLAQVGWVLREIRLRQEMVIHTELLYNFMACHYIREDEPIHEWIESIHNEKVEAFKKMAADSSEYAFFLNLPELRNTTAISNMSPEEWNKHWNDSIREQANLQKKIDYLRSELKLERGRKTSKKVL